MSFCYLEIFPTVLKKIVKQFVYFYLYSECHVNRYCSPSYVLQKVETQKRNTVVIIYFDYLDRREVCPTLHAYKVVKVTNHKPVPVIMYDYYDNGKLQ